MAGTGHWARLEYEDKDLLVEIKVQCFNEPVLESDSAEIGDDGISWTSSASWTSMAGGEGVGTGGPFGTHQESLRTSELPSLPVPGKDIVAGRTLSTVAMLFKFFTVFQPGGGAERPLMLWRSWVAHSMDTESLKVDHRPALHSVMEFAEYLQAEELALTTEGGIKSQTGNSAVASTGATAVKVAALGTEEGMGKSSEGKPGREEGPTSEDSKDVSKMKGGGEKAKEDAEETAAVRLLQEEEKILETCQGGEDPQLGRREIRWWATWPCLTETKYGNYIRLLHRSPMCDEKRMASDGKSGAASGDRDSDGRWSDKPFRGGSSVVVRQVSCSSGGDLELHEGPVETLEGAGAPAFQQEEEEEAMGCSRSEWQTVVETMEHWVWKCCLNQELKRAPMNKGEGQDCGASMEYILQNLDYLEQDLVRPTESKSYGLREFDQGPEAAVHDQYQKCAGAVVGGSDDRAKPLKGEEWNVKLQDRTLGFVITYVDAMSVVSPEEMVASVPERIQAQWKRSPPEWVSEEKWVKFCGLEMKWQAGGLLVGQPSYAASLLEKHPEVRGMQFPFPRGGSEHHGKEGIRGIKETMAKMQKSEWEKFYLLAGMVVPDEEKRAPYFKKKRAWMWRLWELEELHRPPCAILHIDQHLSLWRLCSQREQWLCLSSRLMTVEEGPNMNPVEVEDRKKGQVEMNLAIRLATRRDLEEFITQHVVMTNGFCILAASGCGGMAAYVDVHAILYIDQHLSLWRLWGQREQRWCLSSRLMAVEEGEEQRIFSTCVLQLQDTMGIPPLWSSKVIFEIEELCRRFEIKELYQRGDPSVEELSAMTSGASSGRSDLERLDKKNLRQDALARAGGNLVDSPTEPPSSPLPPGLDMMRPTYRGGTSGSSGARGRIAVQSPVELGMRPWTAEDVEYGFQLPDGDGEKLSRVVGFPSQLLKLAGQSLPRIVLKIRTMSL
ncbi:unnamed protein product [Cladocopium goreaui]|uniref:Kinase D-interacting substrate of 220 kDa n=1 Tax=Cladocopium goreaui TaxID=2562237 RepID=A0A9P1GKD5_9DINO|nr:unnamed protein product [Cladocopium goreaui]